VNAPQARPRLESLVRWAAVAAVLAGLLYFVREMKWRELGAVLASARLWPLTVAACLSFVDLFCKGACWRILLAPSYRLPLMRLFRYTIATFAVSAVTPVRAGEVLRIWLLQSREGVPAPRAVAVAAAEKVLGAASMIILVAPLPWLMPQLPPWVNHSIIVFSLGAAVGLATAWIAAGRVRAPKGFLLSVLAGLDVLREPRKLLGSLALLVAAWAADLAQVWLVLWAVGIDQPLAAGLLILLTLNIAIMIPSTPAQIGPLELGAVAALVVLGVPPERGMAFALLYHGMQIIPLVLVGAADYRFVLDARRAADADPIAEVLGRAPGRGELTRL
jgi:hypothetical protein